MIMDVDASNTKRVRDQMSPSSSSTPPHKVQRVDEPTSPDDMDPMDSQVIQEMEGLFGSGFRNKHAGFLLVLLITIVSLSPGLDQIYAYITHASALIKNNKNLVQKLALAWENQNFSTIRDLEVLQKAQPVHRFTKSLANVGPSEQLRATVDSWRTPYEPGAEKVFLKIINERFKLKSERMYGNQIAVVQSSGTGKSRMLHEVSAQVFAVIMNFADDSASGYPRPDGHVRDYLMKVNSASESEARATRFFIALFDLLAKEPLATPSELQSFLGYGDPSKEIARAEFFQKVIKAAEGGRPVPLTPPGTQQSPPIAQFQTREEPVRSLDGAGRNLCKVLLRKLNKPDTIQLVLGFDEASKMTVPLPGTNWDVFTRLRRVFQALRDVPIYSAFMSTTGSSCQFPPQRERDNSARRHDGTLQLWPPFTLVGFDQLAQKLKEGDTLDDATSLNFMLGLGRPLFKTRYRNGSQQVKSTIIDFAKAKLLNGGDENNMSSLIAPLAVRLPLKFNSLTDKGRQAEQLQVESHMRLCLNIPSDADVMYTVAPSEPSLIEAAAQIMSSRDSDKAGHSVGVLQQFLSDRYLSKGDRGELASMLLMLLAHDQASRSYAARIPSMPYHTPIPVTDFLKALFAERHHATILEAKSTAQGETLETLFSNSWVHFTHFIQVTDYKVVNRQFLLRMMARGAAMLCADNQLGIDAIIPICLNGKQLTLNNITAALVQDKNVAALGKPRTALFTNMDPYYVGVFEKGFNDCPPVIKIVFSVGTEKTGLFRRPVPEPQMSTGASIKTPPPPAQFDIFAGGLSHETFGPIREEDQAKWRELVSRSGVEDIYGLKVGDAIDGDRHMTPCARSEPNHWAAFFPLVDRKVDEGINEGSVSDSEEWD